MQTYSYAGSQATYSPIYGLILPGNNVVDTEYYDYFDMLVLAWAGSDNAITGPA